MNPFLKSFFSTFSFLQTLSLDSRSRVAEPAQPVFYLIIISTSISTLQTHIYCTYKDVGGYNFLLSLPLEKELELELTRDKKYNREEKRIAWVILRIASTILAGEIRDECIDDVFAQKINKIKISSRVSR